MIVSSCAVSAQSDDTQAQPGESALLSLPPKYYDNVSERLGGIEQQIDKKTAKYLQKIERQERKLFQKLWKKDSAKAKELFGVTKERYDQLPAQAREQAARLGNFSKVYSSKLDSLSTAFKFLDNGALSPDLQKKMETSISGIKSLQTKLDQTDQIKKYLKARKQLLTEQLEKFGMLKDLKRFNKEVYYFQEQVKVYKELLDNPSKLEGKLLGLLSDVPAFKRFFANNSQLGSLFNLPGSANSSTASLSSLQTRSSVVQQLQSRLGNQSVQQIVGQNIQSAQSELNQLKNKVNQYMPQGGSSEEDMPVGIKKNDQRTKSFWQKWEIGMNVQSSKGNTILPVSSDLGLSAGYRPHNNFIAGVGLAGRIGWGKDLRHINLTYSGISARSFAELKIKGSFHAVAGFEMNYRSEFKRFEVLKDYNAWTESGLVGVSKIVSMKNKFFKKTKFQLMWDFLSYQQVPRTEVLKFRIGYNF